MEARGSRKGSENTTSTTLPDLSLAEEVRSSLDPRQMRYDFIHTPPCDLGTMVRDLPAIVITLVAGETLWWGVGVVHERFNLPDIGIIRSAEGAVFLTAFLVSMGAAHYINRRLPSPFGH